MVKQEMISGQFHGTTFAVITLNRESNFTFREQHHSQFHFEYINVTRATSTTLDVMLERSIDDFWNIRRRPRSFICVDEFHMVHHFG